MMNQYQPPVTILLVEDDAGVALLERKALERCGYRVLDVATACAALAALQQEAIDLIVMDFRLADGTNGLHLHSQMQAQAIDVPTIMVTGFSNEATAIEALRQGVRDFVPKSLEYLDYLPVAVQRVWKAVTTERQLSESQARFQAFMDHCPAVAFVKDAAGRLLYSNRRFVEECGHTECVGKLDEQLWPEVTARQLRAADLAVLANGTAMQSSETVTDGNGSTRHWLTCRFPLADGSDRPMVAGMAIDVTAQHIAERELQIRDEQLRQSQKMEAVGQLAGGVAHDFNNLLTIIMGYSDVLSSSENTSASAQSEMLGEIHKAAERAALLTRQLLAFSRKQILEPSIINLNDIVTGMERMLGRLIGEDIIIHTRLSHDLHTVFADPGQVEQVIMNLVVNARDAMPHGGEIGIETDNVYLDNRYAQSHAEVVPGKYVLLAISDSGCGMSEETKAKIFEPFFTTKPPGKGTGLGLATVYGIVKQSGGHLWAYSETGQGSTFKIYLPTSTPVASKVEAGGSEERPLRGNETILLVEDETGVRTLARNVLEMYGYTVLEAKTPSDAVRVHQTYEGRIDVLLTDVVMPQMNGKRLSELLLADRPDMKVIFMSGYTDDAIVRQGVLQNGVNFLQKPFVPMVLTAKVRDALEPTGA